MKFFVCDDPHKITNHEVHSYGKWYFCFDNNVTCYEGNGFIILYSGYGITRPLEELVNYWEEFKVANGNFFAVRMTKDSIDYAIDYFNNHKLFSADKYGYELTNHLPYMTINEEDVIRNTLDYEPFLRREFGRNDTTTFFGHINSLLPDFDYVEDCRKAYNSKERRDPDWLVEYIHQCMTEHAQVIKDKYPNRFISLSDGMDSALQSQYFYDDPQYIYTIVPCHAGEEGHKYKREVANHYPNVKFEEWNVADNVSHTYKYLNDSATRWATILPTMKQVADCATKPDIVLYGVNGDEMFFRDLIPHMQLLALEYYDRDRNVVIDRMRKDLHNKKEQYGASYTLGNAQSFESYLNGFMDSWFNKERLYEVSESTMLKWTTPKFYTRAISQNNDVLTASLYNDRRIFHEVLKAPKKFLIEQGMDSPIQRRILKEKFDYDFSTPHKDALYADYEEIFEHVFNSTVPSCMEQNV